MMTHIEGPIVDAFYDVALVSWHIALDPPLPSYQSPAAAGGVYGFVPSAPNQDMTVPVNGSTIPNQEPIMSAYGEQTNNASLQGLDDQQARPDQGATSNRHVTIADRDLAEHTSKDPHYDVDIAGEVARVQNSLRPRLGESRVQAVTRHLSRYPAVVAH